MKKTVSAQHPPVKAQDNLLESMGFFSSRNGWSQLK
jgi:hypothetical protein